MPELTRYVEPTKPEDNLRIWRKTRGPQLHELPAMRMDLVNRCRAEVAAAGYGSHGCRKLDAAADRLLAELTAPAKPPLRYVCDDAADDMAEHDAGGEA